MMSVQSGTVVKLPKFEVELLTVPKPPCLTLKQRDVTLATMLVTQIYSAWPWNSPNFSHGLCI